MYLLVKFADHNKTNLFHTLFAIAVDPMCGTEKPNRNEIIIKHAETGGSK